MTTYNNPVFRTDGDQIPANDHNDVAERVIRVYDSIPQRDADIPTPYAGQVTAVGNLGTLQIYRTNPVGQWDTFANQDQLYTDAEALNANIGQHSFTGADTDNSPALPGSSWTIVSQFTIEPPPAWGSAPYQCSVLWTYQAAGYSANAQINLRAALDGVTGPAVQSSGDDQSPFATAAFSTSGRSGSTNIRCEAQELLGATGGVAKFANVMWMMTRTG